MLTWKSGGASGAPRCWPPLQPTILTHLSHSASGCSKVFRLLLTSCNSPTSHQWKRPLKLLRASTRPRGTGEVGEVIIIALIGMIAAVAVVTRATQRFMDHKLHHMKAFCQAFIDDVCVFSNCSPHTKRLVVMTLNNSWYNLIIGKHHYVDKNSFGQQRYANYAAIITF